MKQRFPQYYRLSEEEFQELWEHADVVLDTNVLLNLYRYGEATADYLLSILDEFGERVWVPCQVGWEFSKNRPSVILTQTRRYNRLQDELNELRESALTELDKLIPRGRHPYLELEQVKDRLNTFFQDEIEDVEELAGRHPDLLGGPDDRLARLEEILEDRIGHGFSDDELEELLEEAKTRYESEIPPGYKDANKDRPRERYGDLIIWKEMIAHAAENGRPIIFVSDDEKEDWWWIVSGHTLGPRPELVNEMLREAEVRFHIYTASKFIDYAAKHLEEIADNQDAVDEAEEVRLDQMPYASMDVVSQYEKLLGTMPASEYQKILDQYEKLLGTMPYASMDVVSQYRKLLDQMPASEYRKLLDQMPASEYPKIVDQYEKLLGKMPYASMDVVSQYEKLLGTMPASQYQKILDQMRRSLEKSYYGEASDSPPDSDSQEDVEESADGEEPGAMEEEEDSADGT